MRFGEMLMVVLMQGMLLVVFFGSPFGNPLSRLGAEDHVTVDKHFERQWRACQADLAQAEHDRDLLKGAATNRSRSWLEAIGLGVIQGIALFAAFASLHKLILGRWTPPYSKKKRPPEKLRP